MENKEIIVDGVDISECFHYINNKEYTCRLNYTPFHYRHCEENPNCYYKQLARKNAECEELKEQLEFLQASSDGDDILIGTYMDKVSRLSKALDEIETYCMVIKQTTCNFKDCNNRNDIEFIKMLLDIINNAKDINVPHKKDGSNE